MGASLAFKPDGKFKIVQFTDLHWGDGNDNDLRTRSLMEKVIQEERPDLAVITGDLIESMTCSTPKVSIRHVVAPMEQSGTPWAAVFGNHDSEENVTRLELMESWHGVRYGLTEAGPKGIAGEGNYIIRLTGRSGRTDQALFFLDSGDYEVLPVGGYATFHRNQIDWFSRESAVMTAENGGAPVPALAFFHIPLPEYNEVWDFRECRGHKFEDVCCPLLNSGMFAAMVQAGNVTGTFAGHDHANDFCGELHGITLGYGRKTGYNNYGKEGLANGARVIELTEGARGFRTWLRLDTGETVTNPPVHQPEGRRSSDS